MRAPIKTEAENKESSNDFTEIVTRLDEIEEPKFPKVNYAPYLVDYLSLLKEYSWSEIEAFCIRQQIDLSPWESTTLFLMGDAYQIMLSKAQNRNCPSPCDEYQSLNSQYKQEEKQDEQVAGAFASLRSIAKANIKKDIKANH